MRVVSNTSPLSNLAVIGELELLQKIYSKVIIPPTVHDELIRFQEIRSVISNVIEIGWLEVQTPQNTQLIQTLNQFLDPGEASAIALAIDISADRLLIDERIGRSIASQYNQHQNSRNFGHFSQCKKSRIDPYNKTAFRSLDG